MLTGKRCEIVSFLLPHNLITRNSSGDEIANVNFLYDEIVHALDNAIDLHKFHHRLFSTMQVYQIH